LNGAPGDAVRPGEEGELIVDANVDTIFSGYLNRPDATAEKVRDGWYYTGDIVRLENDGDVTLMGRVDDMIRSGGENIHPEEVEAALESHPGVAACSAVGIADPRWGQIVVACIVPDGDTPDIADLDTHCRQSALVPFKRPRGYLFVDAFPRNAAGKVLRRLLRDAATEARAAGDASYRALDPAAQSTKS
jgi:2-furoate---CoA ligase